MNVTLNGVATPIKTRLKAESTVVSALATATNSFQLFQAQALLFAEELDPASSAVAYRAQIASATTTAARQALQDKIGRLTGPAAMEAQQSASAQVRALFPQVVTDCNALIDVGTARLNTYLSNALADEATLFVTAWGFPTVPTQISIAIRGYLAQLVALRAGMTEAAYVGPVRPLPSTSNNAILDWFNN